jgi:MoaA/NifB/PqqE/SkfB family radical SAM enzyme
MKDTVNNIEYTNYTEEQIVPIAKLAKELGVMIHINGFPFGAFGDEKKTVREEVTEGEFHDKVVAAMNSKLPLVSHEEAMRRIRATIDKKTSK